MIEKICSNLDVFSGLSLKEACTLAENTSGPQDLVALMDCAEKVRIHFQGDSIDLCSIINAKSGRCSEDCRFCAQSIHHNTEIETYEFVDGKEALACAQENDAHGVERFSLVTAGRAVSSSFLDKAEVVYKKIQAETDLALCASMGFLTKEIADRLYGMGVTRYHCNLEASRSFFPTICTTHTWQEKVETIQIARSAGMDVCSGGIIGLGETMVQRLELASELQELGVLSIPLNILNPIPNTPLADIKPLTEHEILVTFCLFRLMNPRAIIRTAGGRNILSEGQHKLFQTGVNGAIVGDYLTTAGDGLKKDIAMFTDLGFTLNRCSK